MAQNTNKMVGLVLGIVVSLIFLGYLLPIGFNAFFNANWTHIGDIWNGTHWIGTPSIDSGIANMIVTVIPIVIVLGVVLALLGAMKIKGKL